MRFNKKFIMIRRIFWCFFKYKSANVVAKDVKHCINVEKCVYL